MQRRTFVAATLGSLAIAGCIGDSGDDAGEDDDDVPGNSTSDTSGTDADDTKSEYERDAEELISALQAELDLAGDPGWEITNGNLHVRFYEVPTDHDAVAIVAEAYAMAVEQDIDFDATFSAIDPDSGDELYAFEIEAAWAEAYNAGEKSESSYHEAIEDTRS